MTHFLVVTAMGTDRAGIVSKVAAHISETGCNIVDSRLAILGNEFTFIMLLSGDWNAMIQLESTLPLRSQELELLCVMKRTTRHQPSHYACMADAGLLVADRPGILAACTSFFSAQGCDIHAMRSQTLERDGQWLLQASFELQLSPDIDHENFHQQFAQCCAQLQAIEQNLDIYPARGPDAEPAPVTPR